MKKEKLQGTIYDPEGEMMVEEQLMDSTELIEENQHVQKDEENEQK